MIAARVIGVWDAKVDLVEACLEETGGLGVDIVIDAGGKSLEGALQSVPLVHHTSDFMSCYCTLKMDELCLGKTSFL